MTKKHTSAENLMLLETTKKAIRIAKKNNDKLMLDSWLKERKKLEKEIKQRLEYLRGEIRKECISYGEMAELQDLSKYIDKNDIELLEWAGVEENNN